VLQVTFLFGAVLLLFVMMFSGTLRARLKVFLSKNFFNYHYDYREEWLRFTRTLSEGEPGIQLRERSIQAIAELVDSPGGILWLSQDTGELEQVAHWNMPAEKTAEQLDSSLCQFLEKRQWVIHLDNYDLQPELYDGLDLPEWLRAVPRAWLVVPLILHERLLGFVVLAKSKSNIELDWEVNDLLKTAGMQAASYLAQLEAATALLVARQFESFNRMSAFVVHDLKNLIAQLSLLLSNADKHRDNPEFQKDMVQTIANSRDKMKRLLLQLRGGYSLEPPASVAVHDVVRQAVAARSGLKPAPRFESCAGALSVVAHSARLERVIGHLIQNAVEATPADGEVTVQLSRQTGSAVIEISDTGCGMTEQFMRSRLFKPFESTKLTGMGIGTYEARQYVRELGGRIDVQTAESQGTTFRVMLPLELPDANNAPGYAMEGHA
jgi:putative PEP-CTERM system histidine kinase